MNKLPDRLRKGDLIRIIAPAKAIESSHITFAKNLMEEQGFKVEISSNCLGRHHYFSGKPKDRLEDLQNALDDQDVRAILCARGGYGCVQIMDDIDWSSFLEHPKWLIGFSDVTYLHQRLHQLNIASIHGTMPLNFKENSPEAIATLVSALTGKPFAISASSKYATEGSAQGPLIGGNLSILYSLIGTDDQPDYKGTILFIEDVGEPLYAIDRMLYSFKKAGILEQLSGLLVGGMTSLGDSSPGYGSTYEEIILSHTRQLNIPVCFNFPSGHINDNRALILGGSVQLEVNGEIGTLSYLK